MKLEDQSGHWLSTRIKTRFPLVGLGLFFLGSMHYVERNEGGIGLELPYNMVSWIVVSLLIGAGFFLVAKRKLLVYSRMTVWLFASCCLLSIPTLFPGSRLINESPVHYGLLGGFLFFVAMQQFRPTQKDIRNMFFLVLCGGLIEGLVGWKNYFGISLADLSVQGPGADIPFGVIRQRNALSSLFATTLVMSGYLVGHRYWADSEGVRKKALLLLVYLAPLVVIPLIVLLKSRTGWVGSIVAVGLVLPCLWTQQTKAHAGLWTAVILAGLTVVPLMSRVSDNVEVVESAKMNLGGPRTFIYEQVLDMALDKPLLGYGFGKFESEYNLFAARGYANGDYDNPGYENLSHPHNELLYWWVEGGILGLAGLLLAAVVVLRAITRIPGWREKVLMFALLFPIVFHTQTEIPFISAVSHWIIFILLILAVTVQAEPSREKAMGYFLLPAILSVGVPAVVTVFMVTTLQSGRLLNRIEHDMSVEVSILEDISNPVVWQDRLMWDMNFGLLALGLYQNRPELAANYIAWAPQIIKRKPRAGYFLYLALAYRLIGDPANAQRVEDEARFRFPLRDFDFSLDTLRRVENKNIQEIQANVIED